jgi:hypothetical protein
MNRDMDLARKILLAVESDPNADGVYGVRLSIPGYSKRVISYHVRLLAEDGLIDALDCSSDDVQDWVPRRLTSRGHDFVENSRDEGIWAAAKQYVIEKLGTVSFAALQVVLAESVKRLVLGR